jgi:uncharacterized protein (TIGR03437 family)
VILLPAILCFPLFAAPQLRLTNASIFVKQSAGVSSSTQAVYAYNIGDGALNLSISTPPDSTWIVASVGASEPCPSSPAGCIPLRFTLQTSNLAPGTHTAEIEIFDRNALDAPQTITLTVQVDSTAPAVNAYVNPGATLDVAALPLSPNSIFFIPPDISVSVSTTDGGRWLSASLAFRQFETLLYFDSLIIHFAPPSDMPTGVYTGQVVLTESAATQTLPVKMNVVSGPIANPSPARITMTLAQNGSSITYPFLPYISLTNSGTGSLQVQSVNASGTGVSAYDYGGLAIVTVDPGSLATGTYTDGLVTIQCNAANCPIQIPVSLTIEPQAGPTIYAADPAIASTFFAAPGDVAFITGDQLSLQPAAFGSYPLPIWLGGASVYVNGVPAPLYYTSFGQIAFQVPYSTPPGNASIQMTRDAQASNIVSMQIRPLAPEIVVITDTSYNVIDVNHPASAGEPIVIWANGLGPTNPPVIEGIAAPANPLAVAVVTPSVQFSRADGSSIQVTPSFAGLGPGESGVYQVMVTAPPISGKANVALSVPGLVSNQIAIAIQ